MTQRVLTALPVFNEAAHVEETLVQIRRYADDILVVDDGSSDATPQLLAKQPGIQVITHPQNRGYGAALNSAFEYALANDYDVLITIDCDGQHEPRLIPEMAAWMQREPELDMLSGSRYLKQFAGDSLPPADRRRINMEITNLINCTLGLNLTDTFCGFKAYRVTRLADLKITDFGYAMPLQLWVQAVAAGWKTEEMAVPLIYLDEARSFGGSLDDARRRMAYYRQVLDREMERQADRLAERVPVSRTEDYSRTDDCEEVSNEGVSG